MKSYSRISILMLMFGLILFGLNYTIPTNNEFIVLIGFISLLFGAIFSFLAIAKKEKGRMKFLAVTSFFAILLFVSWFEPFQIVRMMTWIKN